MQQGIFNVIKLKVMKNILSVLVVITIVSAVVSCRPKKVDNKYAPAPAINAAPANPSVLPAASSSQPGTGMRPAINPEHGQPFHDCTIAVGAPLPPVAQPASTRPAQGLPPAQPGLPNNTPGVKLNPAHGQPGHKCELPVGAPLS